MHFFDTLYLLVTFLLSARIGASIRVDWNTNKGPIIPPTPRTTTRPQPPYRAPAPVWEDQSDDIPNPNPYVYVLPPPSRPRPATNNYLTADRRPVTQENYHLYNNQHNYGNLLPPVSNAANFYQNGNAAAGLAPKYVPNVGFKYFAIVPNNSNNNINSNNNFNSFGTATQQHSALGLSNGYHIANDKVQGKYNAKTKKYKAFEKVKYVPPNYPFYEFALPEATPYVPIFDEKSLLSTQQLPALATERPFSDEAFDGRASSVVQNSAAAAQSQPPQLQSHSQPNQIIQPHSPKVAHTKDGQVTKENFGKLVNQFNSNDLQATGKFRENALNDRNGEST